ncbi:cysteine synthase [Caldinitratiruptor microaerophilus]|uniref:Cysteine synthase n=1 Tax=Caldinitratiruptor microaerophilus TaxID=671077 RepID=A0AA35CHS5_9FIRM|nr:cysteine synthase [Caldinitratiruptor microaerophilus]
MMEVAPARAADPARNTRQGVRAVARVAEGIRDLVGNTPLMRLRNMGVPDGVEVYAKLEMFNPGGSVKDRIGVAMLDRAEAEGRLRPGGTVIEPTAGNTGIGLALAAVGRGYRVIFVMPQKFDGEKSALMRALGAEIVLTPNEEGMAGAIRRAHELAAAIPGSFVPNQFENPANPDAHYRTTGPEIWRDLDGRLDVFVAGVGSGGTFTGVARYLKAQDPAIRCVAVEPEGSIIGGGPKGTYKVEGIGNWFVPAVMDVSLADRFLRVPDRAAFDTVRELARREGLLVGSSSGAAVWAALEVARESAPGTRIAVVLPDSSERYLSRRIYEQEL